MVLPAVPAFPPVSEDSGVGVKESGAESRGDLSASYSSSRGAGSGNPAEGLIWVSGASRSGDLSRFSLLPILGEGSGGGASGWVLGCRKKEGLKRSI